jgi:deoxyribodipyrimidine photo-lyase
MNTTAIMWFRRDLRLHDNPAWAAATESHQRVVPVLVIEPVLLDRAGPHRRAAFLHAAARLDQELATQGGRLHVVSAAPDQALVDLATRFQSDALYVNGDVSRWSQRRDRLVEQAFPGVVNRFWGTLVHSPGTVLTKAGTLSRVFTPFAKQWATVPVRDLAQASSVEVLNDPGVGLPALTDNSDRLALGDLRDRLNPDELLDTWDARADAYGEQRDVPAEMGTSALSTALRFGTVSPLVAAQRIGTSSSGRAGFVRQLAWRDWYAHLTFQFPDIDRLAIRSEYDNIDWRTGTSSDDEFAAWTQGQTGYPIVDAGMRQLQQTGWMHNRVRMITASFLVKDLLIDWRRGERHFRHLLSDGEPSQNAGNWQWVAGTGPDAAPYFRIFNPITQSKKFDPDGTYIRRWVPELADLHRRDIHAPWEAGALDLAAAGVVLGDTYPPPIVNHAEARDRTLSAYKSALGS